MQKQLIIKSIGQQFRFGSMQNPRRRTYSWNTHLFPQLTWTWPHISSLNNRKVFKRTLFNLHVILLQTYFNKYCILQLYAAIISHTNTYSNFFTCRKPNINPSSLEHFSQTYFPKGGLQPTHDYQYGRSYNPKFNSLYLQICGHFSHKFTTIV